MLTSNAFGQAFGRRVVIIEDARDLPQIHALVVVELAKQILGGQRRRHLVLCVRIFQPVELHDFLSDDLVQKHVRYVLPVEQYVLHNNAEQLGVLTRKARVQQLPCLVSLQFDLGQAAENVIYIVLDGLGRQAL